MKKIILTLFLVLNYSAFSFEPVILLFGPPGSGKGTFAQFARSKGYNHLSAGDLIRDEIERKTSFGLLVEEIVKKGEYVPPLLLKEMIRNQIRSFSLENKPFIIDGFGRKQEDMQTLLDILSELNLNNKTCIVFFDALNETCKERISNRLICHNCHHVYSTLSNQLHEGSICSNCQKSPLQKRINDTLPVIEKRMLDYRENIESCYKTSFNYFPGLIFNTDKPEADCLKFYDELLNKIEKHQGSLKDLF